MVQQKEPTVTTVIPVHNGGEQFKQCIQSVAGAKPPPDEIIVVADGETDGAYRIAEKYGARIIRCETPGGPAKARNIGAREANGDILFFTDADVAISHDTIGIVKNIFKNDLEIAAIIGSYDDMPAESNFLSQYKNLFHHYVHQMSDEKASTFWTGCGAVRRDVFFNMGGFDETYCRPSIEDIELGYRMAKAGYRIGLVKSLQVKHLKRWDAASLLRVDFFDRALPWTRLILNQGKIPNDLNLKTVARISVILVFLIVINLFTLIFIPLSSLAALLFIAGLILLNSDLYRFFYFRKGLKFTFMAVLCHWLYFFYSGLAFLFGLMDYAVNKIKRRKMFNQRGIRQ